MEGESVELAPSEILVSTLPAEGLAVAADKVITVALDAVLTPELRAEGLAREIVRRVQDMRKNAGFEIADRITTYFVAEGLLAEVVQTWAVYLKNETLTTQLVAGAPARRCIMWKSTLSTARRLPWGSSETDPGLRNNITGVLRMPGTGEPHFLLQYANTPVIPSKPLAGTPACPTKIVASNWLLAVSSSGEVVVIFKVLVRYCPG